MLSLNGDSQRLLVGFCDYTLENKSIFKGVRIYFHSLFENTAHCGVEIMAAGPQGSWPPCISVQDVGIDEL